MELPNVVLAAELQAAIDDIRATEKAATRRDALAGGRHRLTMVRIDTDDVSEGPDGSARRADAALKHMPTCRRQTEAYSSSRRHDEYSAKVVR